MENLGAPVDEQGPADFVDWRSRAIAAEDCARESAEIMRRARDRAERYRAALEAVGELHCRGLIGPTQWAQTAAPLYAAAEALGIKRDDVARGGLFAAVWSMVDDALSEVRLWDEATKASLSGPADPVEAMARELARTHGWSLRIYHSGGDWTVARAEGPSLGSGSTLHDALSAALSARSPANPPLPKPEVRRGR